MLKEFGREDDPNFVDAINASRIYAKIEKFPL
jgi:hypothetical protein